MERREKTEFILEQMRLLIAVARSKDAELGKEGKDSLGGGEAEWVKVRVGGRKINEEFLKEKANEVLCFGCLVPSHTNEIFHRT
jgi:26S proteasome regulatory subunit N5